MKRSSTSVQQNCALIKNTYNQGVGYQRVMVRTDWDLPRAATSVRQRSPGCWTAPRQRPKTLTSSVWTKKLIICRCTFHLRGQKEPSNDAQRSGPAVPKEEMEGKQSRNRINGDGAPFKPMELIVRVYLSLQRRPADTVALLKMGLGGISRVIRLDLNRIEPVQL